MIQIRGLILALTAAAGFAQTKHLALDTAAGLTLHNVSATAVTFQGKKALKLVRSTTADPAATDANRTDHLAIVEIPFTNGTIEVDVAGEPAAGQAAGGARGFVGVAFRVQPDRKTYDCFYVRPTNGRAEDQERRNHSAQYISHPTYTWSKLRQETPSRYESYADMQPATWMRLRIDVDGQKARLYLNNQPQPVLIVNDVKTGDKGKGAVALWLEGSTIAHFADLRIRSR
jgi:hypothetical protein